jgi:hypothetical protein
MKEIADFLDSISGFIVLMLLWSVLTITWKAFDFPSVPQLINTAQGVGQSVR